MTDQSPILLAELARLKEHVTYHKVKASEERARARRWKQQAKMIAVDLRKVREFNLQLATENERLQQASAQGEPE